MTKATKTTAIYVCQARTCRARGSDATLIEIEELASQLMGLEERSTVEKSRCIVKKTGCLGYCSRGPAVAVVDKKKTADTGGDGVETNIHTKVKGLERSAAVVESATQQILPRPLQSNLPDEVTVNLARIQAAEHREHLVSTYQWNKALQNCVESVIEMARNDKDYCSGGAEIIDLKKMMKKLMASAGYPNRSVDCLIENQVSGGGAFFGGLISSAPEGYVQWDLKTVEVVTSHSAVFTFSTADPKRGTPHPRGNGNLPKPNTWHVTLLGCTEEDYTCDGAGKEGPLPWVERDYTPISSALDWERGSCSILIKVYGDGRLTSWLERVSRSQRTKDLPGSMMPNTTSAVPKTKIWLSKPIPTLTVPSLTLVSDDMSDHNAPSSILLFLAGTGIVALPQIMAHRDPIRLLGIPTPRRKQLRCNIDLIHSCREDDALMLPEIYKYCNEKIASVPSIPFKGLRNYTLLLSACNKERGSFEQEISPSHHRAAADTIRTLNGLPNTTVLEDTKLDAKIVKEALATSSNNSAKHKSEIRVVVSGPGPYNAAIRSILVDQCFVDPSNITILSA